MGNNFRDEGIKHTIGARMLSAASLFIYDSLESIIIWLIVMFFVILCDFIVGSRKSLLMKQEYRLSRALRATMGKICTYFSFVIAAVFIEKASGIVGLAKWSIVIVCSGEGISIVNNILKPKGYQINILSVAQWIGKKFTKAEGIEKIIEKTQEGGNDETSK